MDMKRRPWPIILLAVFHLFAPIGNFFFNAQYVPIDTWTYFLAHFESANLGSSLIFFLVPPLAGLAIYVCKKWSFWVYVLLMIFILFFSLYNWKSRPEIDSIIPLVTLFVVNIALVGYFLIPAVRAIYFDPRLRWWETKPRYKVDYKATLSFDGQSEAGEIANLSEGGLFVKVKNSPSDNQKVTIQFVDGNKTYKAEGSAIHHEKLKTMGVGIRFSHTGETLKDFHSLAKKLDSEGKKIEARVPGPEDTLLAWLKRVFKTGEGLVPKSDQNKKS